MSNATATTSPDKVHVSVDAQVIVRAWTLMERLVVSLDRIGSAFAASTDGSAPVTDSAEQKAISDLFDSDTVAQMAQVRGELGALIPDDEAETISEGLTFWTSARH